jgi:hypothetical protein
MMWSRLLIPHHHMPPESVQPRMRGQQARVFGIFSTAEYGDNVNEPLPLA